MHLFPVTADFGPVQIVLITLSFSSCPMCSSSHALCPFSFPPKLNASRAHSVSDISSTDTLSQIDLVTCTVSLYNMSKSFRNGHRTKIKKGKRGVSTMEGVLLLFCPSHLAILLRWLNKNQYSDGQNTQRHG